MVSFSDIFENSQNDFENLAIRIFNEQFRRVVPYNKFCTGLGINPSDIKSIGQIPYLPIELFKAHRVTNAREHDLVFKSSGTTNSSSRSSHFVADSTAYHRSIERGWSQIFQKPITLFALLPNYLEQGESSLVYMIQHLFDSRLVKTGGFYLNNHKALFEAIESEKKKGNTIMLWGVTYALLDFAKEFSLDLKGHIVLETGGMKGRKKELTRHEVHAQLCADFNVDSIWSEYGMTELLSQAYSKGNGVFETPSWMKITGRDLYDPLSGIEPGKTGAINVIDLANVNSCSFIATQDLGRVYANGSFEVLGRMDHSDIRGCNLMLT